jgi:hypothetical protein
MWHRQSSMRPESVLSLRMLSDYTPSRGDLPAFPHVLHLQVANPQLGNSDLTSGAQ